MVRYVLHDDLSFCHAGGRLVFLDVGSDRYLRLPPTLESALVRYLATGSSSDADVSELVARSILVKRSESSAERPSIVTPTRSAMEAPHPAPRVTLLQTLEVLGLVIHTQMTLKRSPFKEMLDVLSGSTPGPRTIAPFLERQVIDAAAAFRRVRLYVPVGMRCLIDSVAMARFLRRRGAHVHVVFGVTVDPFSAHCWVQAGDLVLNDTLGNATSHIPIRVE